MVSDRCDRYVDDELAGEFLVGRGCDLGRGKVMHIFCNMV